MEFALGDIKKYKDLDYIACWFYLGAEYIRNFNAKFAFVSTNSVSQGEQVALLWQSVLKDDLEIHFAHQSFKWTNNAKGNAGVTVAIVGISNISKDKKYIFNDTIKKEVESINPYLTSGQTVYIQKKSKPISDFTCMTYGNYTGGCNELLLSSMEKQELLNENSNAIKFIRKLSGSSEFIQGIERYCLWISDSNLEEALSINSIKMRIEKVEQTRLSSKDESLQKLATRPHQFRDLNEAKTMSLIVPIVSSERRKYIPCGFLDKEYIISNSAQAIYDAQYWNFGIISSYMHMVWMKTVAGRLKSDYRYSASLVYNTFPFPKITQTQKDAIEALVHLILDERDKNYLKTMAELYDPNKMPEGLKTAHHNLDMYIEKCYRDKPFESDEERLEYLFKLYEKMIKEEKQIAK